MKTKQVAQEFLKRHPMGVLSTVANDGKPWGAAIYFVADEDFSFFFVTRSGTQKYKNIEANPHASLTIADPETQTTVQAAGKISRVPVKDTVDIVFKKLAAIKPKDNPDWLPPIIKVHKGDWMILQLTPDHLQYANYTAKKTVPDDEYISTLIP